MKRAAESTFREIPVLAVINPKLFYEVMQGVECAPCIEVFVVLLIGYRPYSREDCIACSATIQNRLRVTLRTACKLGAETSIRYGSLHFLCQFLFLRARLEHRFQFFFCNLSRGGFR